MSLIKQMWIAIGFLVAVIFTSSLVLGFTSAKGYLQEQLALKNVDNANILALTLSQTDKEQALLEMYLLAQFDLGHYQRLELISTTGETLIRMEPDYAHSMAVPAWFQRLVSFDVGVGRALVSSGWQSFGVLEVESHQAYAYESLWQSAWQLLLSMLVIALLSGWLGTWLLKRIIRPLDVVIDQAEAIGNQRFLTAREPRTLEFGLLVKAMNRLSARVKGMLADESQRLEKLRFELEHDPLTQVCNRGFFLNQMDSALNDNRMGQHFALVLVRVADLAGLNQRVGHQECDQLLKTLVHALEEGLGKVADEMEDAVYGRLNGADFAILLKGIADFSVVTQQIEVAMRELAKQREELTLHQSACYFRAGEERAAVLQRADNLLSQSELLGGTNMQVAETQTPAPVFPSADAWREAFSEALNKGVGSQLYPVCRADGSVLHYEAMMRLELAGEVRAAGFFLPWAQRLGLQPDLDLALLKHVLGAMQDGEIASAIAVNLSPEIARRADYLHRLEALLREYPAQASQLFLECHERATVDPQGFALFVELASGFGCRVGIDGVGRSMRAATDFYISGLSYIKVAGAYAQRMNNPADKEIGGFVQRICNLGHTMGMTVILEGVNSADVCKRAIEMGFDALSGPSITDKH